MTPEEEHDEKQAVITAMFVVITIFAVLCALASSAGADDSAYLRARAAIAINASIARPEQPTQTLPTVAKPPARAKPEIWTFYAPFHCPPCETQKADLKAWKDAPFAFRNGDVNNAPVRIESYPTTCWKVDGKWWSYSGWHGTEHLEREWKRSQSNTSLTSATRAAAGTLTQTGSLATHQWSYPGSIRSHLAQQHHISETELSGLSRQQMEAIHAALHEGYSIGQIRAWARSRGYIK